MQISMLKNLPKSNNSSLFNIGSAKARMTLATVATLATLTLTACGADSNPANDANKANNADNASETINLKIATESSYKPFSYLDTSGKEVGYEIDLMNALCEEMKANCEITSQDWEGLIPGLKAKKFDAVIAGMSITPERLEVVDFSAPYFTSGIILTAKVDKDISIDKLDGVAVGAQRSTVSSEYLEKNAPNAKTKLYDTQENAYIDLTNGRLEALVMDKVIGLDWLKNNADKGYEQKGTDISTGNDDMGIAVRKGDELKAKFDTALTAIKANGKYDEITNKYFGNGSAGK